MKVENKRIQKLNRILNAIKRDIESIQEKPKKSFYVDIDCMKDSHGEKLQGFKISDDDYTWVFIAIFKMSDVIIVKTEMKDERFFDTNKSTKDFCVEHLLRK